MMHNVRLLEQYFIYEALAIITHTRYSLLDDREKYQPIADSP